MKQPSEKKKVNWTLWWCYVILAIIAGIILGVLVLIF